MNYRIVTGHPTLKKIVDYLAEDYMETIRLLQAYAILEVEDVTFDKDVFVNVAVLHRIAPPCLKECYDINMNVENSVSFQLVFNLFPNVIILDISVVTGMGHLHVFLPAPREMDDLFGDLDVKALYEMTECGII
uniref:ACT domain-containing protein n=1 Tax=Panagrellus redivivus TaxID=6233 RepID=A0A7E4V9E1_PANRE